MSVPFTSVIICSRDRPESFQRALASVLAQDTDEYEVIVVDGSDPAVVVPENNPVSIRVIASERRGEGFARLTGLRAAQTDLIAWCDDDDEWLPGRLRMLRDALVAQPGVDLVYTASAHAIPPIEPSPVGFSIRAGDVIHRATAALAAGGFDYSLRAHAAGDLWARMVERGRVASLPHALTLHHSEPGSATPEEQAAALQRLQRDWEDTARRSSAARERMARRGQSVTSFDRTTWNDEHRELIFQTLVMGPESFQIVARTLIRGLLARGVRVTLGPLRDGRVRPDWGGIDRPLGPHNQLGMVYDFRSGPAELHSERTVCYAMWETTVVPTWQVEEINAAALLLYTPCQESACIAAANGIEPPARVLHHGVDAARFPYLERQRTPSQPFTFGSNGVLSARKGIDVLLRAFQEEFTSEEPVRLALRHSYTAYKGETPSDPRITLERGFLKSEGLLEYLAGLDAYVLPSRGEGFGMTGLEAMATGLPLIATNWSGPVEYLDPSDTFPLRYHLEETGGALFQNRRQFGLWAEPDAGHLRELLRYVYEHRAEAADAGRRASARVQRDWTWERVVDQLVADFDLLARGALPGSE